MQENIIKGVEDFVRLGVYSDPLRTVHETEIWSEY